ncbi:hypothetical protein V6N13_088706 [Hibiscus sabdariffa]
MESSILESIGQEIIGVMSPVSLCMLLVVLLVYSLSDSNPFSSTPIRTAANLVYLENPSDSAAQKLEGALLNALVFVILIALVTFLLVLLYYYNFTNFLKNYMRFSAFFVLAIPTIFMLPVDYNDGAFLFFFLVLSIPRSPMVLFMLLDFLRGDCCFVVLGTMGGSIFLSVIQHFSIPIDSITCFLLLFNYTVVGVLSMFSGGVPIILRQGYMVSLGIIVATWFTKLPEWTTWVLLVALALYDLVAVLAPGGPLKLLVELASSRDEELPALVYEARPTVSHNEGNPRSTLGFLVAGVSDSGSVELQAVSNNNVHGDGSENRRSPEYAAIPVRNLENMEGERNRDEGERLPLVGHSRERYSSDGNSSEYSTVIRNRESEIVVDEERSPLVDMLGMENERDHGRGDSVVASRGIKLGLGDFVFYSVLITVCAYSRTGQRVLDCGFKELLKSGL